MEESTQKRVRRTPQQMAEAIDVKIAAQQREISGIEEKRAKQTQILTPKSLLSKLKSRR